MGDAGGLGDEGEGILLPAAGAVVAQGGAVQLVDDLAPGGLMQAIDVLGDHGLELAGPLQLGQLQVRSVGLGPLDNHLVPVEAVELGGIFLKKRVAQDRLRGVVVLLVIQPVGAAEIRDAGLGGNTGPAEEHDVLALVDPVLQFTDVFVHGMTSYSSMLL